MDAFTFGSIVRFEDLKPGNFFISSWNDKAVFGIAAKFQKDDGIYCAMFNPPVDGKGFDVDSFASHESVWRIEGAIFRPKIDPGALQLAVQIAIGRLILAADGNYLVCRHGWNGAILRINLENGTISSPADPFVIVENWEIGILNSKTNEWHVVYEHVTRLTE